MKKAYKIIIFVLFIIILGITGKQEMMQLQSDAKHYKQTYGVDYTQI